MKTCKQCSKKVKIHIRCFKCDGIYHGKCLGKIPTVYINEQGHVLCCRNITSIQNSSQENSEVSEKPRKKVKEKCLSDSSNGLENRTFGLRQSKGQKYKCDKCSLNFLKKTNLEEHNRKCPYNVKQCKKKKRIKKKKDTNVDIDEVLKNGERICTTKEKHGPRQCSQSNNKIQYKCTYKNGKYECNAHECVTENERNPKSHTSTKHSTQEKQYACKDCEYSTDYKAKLVLHLRGHVKGHPRDPLLESHTSKKATVNNHIHCSEKLCDVCGLAVNGKIHLKCHVLRKHRDEEKKYRCTDCEYSTNFIRVLVLHLRIHNLVV